MSRLPIPFRGLGVSLAVDSADLDLCRFLPRISGDEVVALVTFAGGGGTLRPVYVYPQASIAFGDLVQYEDPTQDFEVTQAGSYRKRFEGDYGAYVGFKVVALAGTSVTIQAGEGQG